MEYFSLSFISKYKTSLVPIQRICLMPILTNKITLNIIHSILFQMLFFQSITNIKKHKSKT